MGTKEVKDFKGHSSEILSSQGNLPSEPSWIPSTHHAVPQPAGHECAQWYEWANPSASEILHALAHTKAERDRLRERVAELEEALEKLLTEASHSFKTGSPFDRPILLANIRALLAKTK